MASSEPKKPDIHELAKEGKDVELLERLKVCVEGAFKDVNERDARGLTPLQHAVLNNRPAVVELLLFRAGEFNKEVGTPDHTVKDDRGETLAHYAAKARAQGNSDGIPSGSDIGSSTSSGLGGSGDCMELLIKKDKEANQGKVEIIYVRDKVNLQTPLHYAVVYGSRSCVSKILEADKNRLHDNLIHMKDKQGMTPLHLAATYSQIDIAKVLIEKGARVTDVDNTISTPLHYVCATGNIQMVDDILGTSGNYQLAEEDRRHCLSTKDNWGNTCLHIAAENGHCEVVKKLLELKIDTQIWVNASEGQRDTMSPLHLAVISGNKKIVMELLQHEVYASERRRDTMSPLHLAVISGNKEIVVELLKRIGNSQPESQAHSTPLHMAAQHNRVEIAKLLLEHNSKVDMTDLNDNTPLHIAAQYGHPGMVVVLMKAGADIRRRNVRGRIPLHGAAANNNKTALDEILDPQNSPTGIEFMDVKRRTSGKTVEDRDQTLKTCDNDKHNPKGKHFKTNSVVPTTTEPEDQVETSGKTVEDRDQTLKTCEHDKNLLMRYKHNIVNTEDNDGNTPLRLAVANGHEAIVKCLLEQHHAEYKKKIGKITTALHLAASNCKNKCVNVIVELHSNLVSAEDATGNTPLHLAAREGHTDTVDILIARGANVNQINLHKKTPINLASEFGQLDICKQLLNLGSQARLGKDGVSSLHLACEKGHLKIVKLLLKTVGDVTFPDDNGLNCLDIAIRNGHKDIARYIIQSDFWRQAMRNAVPRRKGSKKIDTPMRTMIRDMPDVAYEVLDKCCTDITKKTENDKEKPKKKFKYNYEFIDDLMTKDNWSLRRKEGTNHEYSAYTRTARVLKKNHPLQIMVKHERTELLQHKLVSSLVKFKWFSFGAFYYLITFFIHMFFLILLTRHVVVTKPPHMYSSSDAKNIMNDNCGAAENAWLPAEKVLMYILMVIGAVFEIIQITNMKLAYFADFENYVEWIVYIFSFLFLLDFNNCTIKTSYRQDWQWSVGAFALFFSWIDLVMYLKAFTSLGLYVIMFQMVCWTFCKVFIVFFSLILAFAMGFFTLLRNQVAFRDIPNSILKTAVMFLGEIDYNDLFNGGVDNITVVDTTNLLYPTATSLLFSFFITMACIVLMNLLVGLAVDDIKGILRKAEFKRCAMHIALVLDVEKVLFESIRRRFYIKRDIKNIRTHDDADGDDDDDRGWKKGWNFVLSWPMWWWNQTVERDEMAALDIIPDIARRQQQSEEKMEEIKEKTEEIKKLVEIKKKTKGFKKKIDKRLEKMEKQMNRLLEMLAQNGNNTAVN